MNNYLYTEMLDFFYVFPASMCVLPQYINAGEGDIEEAFEQYLIRCIEPNRNSTIEINEY